MVCTVGAGMAVDSTVHTLAHNPLNTDEPFAASSVWGVAARSAGAGRIRAFASPWAYQEMHTV